MKLKYFIYFLIFFCLLTGACSQKTDNKASHHEKPNILLILTDDQGYPTLGCYGGQKVPTPNLDKLAQNGARFTSAYVTSQCTPTRATLLTGQYTARNGLWHVLPWYGYPYAKMTEARFVEQLSRNTFTIAKGLQSAGYRTAIFGKWHLTSNTDGHYRGLQPEAAHYYGFDYAPEVLPEEAFAEGADRGVYTLTRQAIQFMDDMGDQPWFCYLSHHMIHGKVVAPDSVVERYHELGYTDEGPYRAVYLAGLDIIDHSVGMILQHLEETDILDNTVVIFLSDNGGIDERLDFRALPVPNPQNPMLEPNLIEYDNEPLRAGKGSAYEGGVRVPMIIHWPGMKSKGTVLETPVHAVDIAPTLFRLAGVKTDQVLDGEDLTPLLEGLDPGNFNNRAIFQYYPLYDLLWGLTPSATIRKGDFKLIEFFGDRFDQQNQYIPGHHIELYDLRKDIGETINLADREPELTRELLGELHAWMDTMKVPVSSENPYHNPDSMFVVTNVKPAWLQ